jgi:hypothetical protein
VVTEGMSYADQLRDAADRIDAGEPALLAVTDLDGRSGLLIVLTARGASAIGRFPDRQIAVDIADAIAKIRDAGAAGAAAAPQALDAALKSKEHQ